MLTNFSGYPKEEVLWRLGVASRASEFFRETGIERSGWDDMIDGCKKRLSELEGG